MTMVLGLAVGKMTFIDDEDFKKVSKYKWSILNKGYARSGNNPVVLMHRLVMNANKNEQVDHINGNKLDNRKSNLRICTSSQNAIHKDLRSDNTSGYKGVNLQNRKWRARLMVKGKYIHIGYFTTRVEAAKAYNSFAKKNHGKFAILNNI